MVAIATQRNPHKEQLHTDILQLREQGQSYRQIAQVVELHWTHVGQILKDMTGESP